jgi:transposase
MEEFLFDRGPSERPSPGEVRSVRNGTPRLRVPQRDQIEMHWSSLDELLEADHRARLVWAAVSGLDLQCWLSEIKALEGHVGRNATDPRLLVALWVYATLEGIGSARELARLCEKHLAYQWLCGGVTMNYHLLADFRSQGGDKWDGLLTQLVASLLASRLVTMNRVAQDGVRVRASAGKSSFRRQHSLETCLQQAREQVATLRQLAEESPDDLSKRQRAARERAARERQTRVEEAIRQCAQLQAQREAIARKSGRQPTEARASTTDPEARVMQFSAGGYRPGYNVQFATDTRAGIVVGVEVTSAGTDFEQLPPMLKQLKERYGRAPREVLVDGGFASLDAVEAAAQHDCLIFAPLKDVAKQLARGRDPYARRPGDSEAAADWRARMGTAKAQKIYRLRGQTAEWVNALARNRGLKQLPVRGSLACRAVALLYAISHNVLQAVRLTTATSAA